MYDDCCLLARHMPTLCAGLETSKVGMIHLGATQVSSSRTAEELSSRLRSVESALAATRDEALRAEAATQRLRQEVATQQDVVKVSGHHCNFLTITVIALVAFSVTDVASESWPPP